jgi:DnaJ-class molecular chaperone
MRIELNYYQLLNLNFDFSPKDIKDNYRSISRIHHPDKGGDTHFFSQITEANTVLTNPELRAKYDKTSIYGKDYNPEDNVSQTQENDLWEISRIDAQAYKLMVNHKVNLSDIPEDRILKFNRFEPCDSCDSTGAKKDSERDECEMCDSVGSRDGITCPYCKGLGFIALETCPDCKGDGRVLKKYSIAIPIDVEVIENEGHYCPFANKKRGDIIISK